MGYIDKSVLQDGFLSENQPSLQELMATVDKNRIEQDILHDGGDVFQPFLSRDELDKEAWAGMSLDDYDLLKKVQGWIQGSPVDIELGLKQLQRLKHTYPNMPIVFHFISVSQHYLGQDAAYDHTIKIMHEKFPYDLLTNLALAKNAVLDGCYDSIPELLQHQLQLYMHYPNKGILPVFHSSEVQAFYMVVGRYYVEKKQLARAIKCYFLVKEANSNSPYLDRLAHAIFGAEVSDFLLGNFEKIKNNP